MTHLLSWFTKFEYIVFNKISFENKYKTSQKYSKITIRDK